MILQTNLLWFFIAFIHGQESSPKRQNLQIINGRVVKPEEAKFVVALTFENGGQAFCGGSLIDRETILTAAHCLDAIDKIIVRYGTHNLDDRNFPDIEVRRKIIHPDYIPGKTTLQANDIAILKLLQPVEISDSVSFVELPEEEENDYDEHEYRLGTKVTTYGWGIINEREETSDLLKTNLRIVDPDERDYYYTEEEQKDQIYALCRRSSTCVGDSGGPLVLDNVLIGIVSGGASEKCEPDNINVFVKVQAYLDWIQENR